MTSPAILQASQSTRTEAQVRAERTTPGQLAYEADLAAKPLYHDNRPRPLWRDLSTLVQGSWERNPTPRRYLVEESAQ